MRKRKLRITLLIMAAVTLTSCGTVVPEMSEEENAQVVEYAAGLLLKYDKNYGGRLLDEEEAVEAEIKLAEKLKKEAEKKAAEAAAQVLRDEAELNQETAADNSEGIESKAIISSIEEFYGLEGIQITYTGFELKDQYPENGDENKAFALNATKDCKLLVLQFDLYNAGQQDRNVDMITIGPKLQISVNNNSPKYALTTMLTDDLSSFAGTVAAGETQKLVLLGELPNEETAAIESISLIMKNDLEEATALLH